MSYSRVMFYRACQKSNPLKKFCRPISRIVSDLILIFFSPTLQHLKMRVQVTYPAMFFIKITGVVK